jgi:hypothetical protein
MNYECLPIRLGRDGRRPEAGGRRLEGEGRRGEGVEKRREGKGRVVGVREGWNAQGLRVHCRG